MFGKYFLVDGAAKEDGGPSNARSDTPPPCSAGVKGCRIVCMIGLYAYNPPAILEAAKSKSMVGKIKIVGFDENWVTLRAIARRRDRGDRGAGPFNYGYKSVEVARGQGPGRRVEASW